MIHSKIAHLYPPIGDRSNGRFFSISTARPAFGDVYPIRYVVYDVIMSFSDVGVVDFCSHIGMDEEHTLLWMLRFGDTLPSGLYIDDMGDCHF